MADWFKAGTTPPVVFLVQGRMVREVTTRESTALQVTMIVLVDMQLGPVYLSGGIRDDNFVLYIFLH